MLPVFSSTILTLQAPENRMRCRVQHSQDQQFEEMDLSLVYGTQGLICTLWPAPHH